MSMPSGPAAGTAGDGGSGGGQQPTGPSTPSVRPAGPQPPSVELPRGGGAIRGIGEKFAANPVTGTGSLTIPLPLSPGRSEFTPSLALAYDSGAGQGSFGMGWGVGLPTITRKTDKGLPTYQDAAERDVFVLSGAEDLVPTTGADGRPLQLARSVDGRDYAVVRYRPRVEGLHARIERWRDLVTDDVHWRSVSRENVTTIYGKDAESRIADPDSVEGRVFSWLACESFDDRGNAVVYGYRREDSAGVDTAAAHERTRTEEGRTGNRHLKSVRYGNRISTLVEPDLSKQSWHFELLFDYGEHDAENPVPGDGGEWLCRNDPFSNHRAGFDVRNYRLCQRILMFHHFPDEAGVGESCLVRSMTLTYRGSAADGEPAGTFLGSVRVAGHRRDGGGYVTRWMPPVDFAYSTATIGTEVHELDAASVANLPVGLDGPGYVYVDLDGESIPGVLSEQAGARFYVANRGEGQLGPVAMLPTQPMGAAGTQLLDLAGDGTLGYVSFDGPTPGVHKRVVRPEGERDWAPHRPLRSMPAVNWADPNLRFIDLNGDGRADLVVIDEDGLVWYASLGDDGFEPGIRMTLPQDEWGGPRLFGGDRTQAIFTADMSGDGLTDLVWIRNGSVCYWPNLGHGRIGAPVAMDGPAGPFDRPDRFDPRRVRLADVDGSGPTDLVYLGADGVDLYLNQSGNRWSEPQRVPAFPAVDDLASASVVDLLGRGTACLVWSSMLPADAGRHIRYVDLMTQKPNLLTRVRNNLGTETALSYASSTTFYLADKEAGTPWITRLPFPVHVLTGIETYDRISRNRFTTSYTYHHGYFDGHEREFRGFGMVEQTDTELLAATARSTAFPEGANEAAATRMAPVVTRTWFHNGAHLDRHRISTLFADGYYPPPEHATPEAASLLLPDTVLPPDLAEEAEREACRALKGQLLRQEVYAIDGPAREAHPYTVVERNYTVAQLGDRVFAVHPRDTVTINYEREPADPRVTHELVLAVDGYGTVLHSAALAYRRAVTGAGLPERTVDVQSRTLVTETRTEVTDLVDRDDAYRVPVPYTTRTFEVAHAALTEAAAVVDRDDLIAALTPLDEGRRLVDRTRTLFEDDNLVGPLPPGEQGSRALVHEAYRLVLSPELVGSAFGPRVDAALLTGAGYVEGDAGWWAPSGRVEYAPAGTPDELAYARAHFFGPRRFVDPFGGTSAVELDAYDLQPLALTDPVGNVVAARPDYRVLAPDLVTDPNGNQVQALFDALGLVVATAVRGKPGDETGDTLDGLDPDASWSGPLTATELLGRATTRTLYDLDASLNSPDADDPQPVAAATIARERHVRDADPSPVQVAVGYSDGMGREIQRKAQTEPTGWVASGWTVFNNKNLPVKQYEPFFTDTHRFEFAVLEGVSSTLCYDPVGRVVATLHPDQTWEKVDIGAWQQETWDANDTLLIPDPAEDEDVGALLARLPEAEYKPTWYQRRITGGLGAEEQTAAEHTELHAGTPTLAVLDPLGRPVLTVARNRTPGDPPVDTEHRTHVILDIEGNQLEVRDCPDGTPGPTVATADRLVARYTYDLAGARLVEESMEAGTRRGLVDVLGMPCATWDHTDRRTTTRYDAARRPVELVLRDAGGEKVVGRTEYGESAPAGPDNLHGRAWQVFDAAGVVTHAYDLAGNPRRVARQLTREYRETVDWGSAPDLGETWTVHSVFDALNRPIEITHPDGTVARPVYDRRGLLMRVSARLAGDANDTLFVEKIVYDPLGRRKLITHGNRVTSTYGYDERTFRLRSIDTRTQAGDQVQQLRYTYDPVGNVARIGDGAQPLGFNVNTVIDASMDYRHDAVYRLVEARGREHRGGDSPTTWDDAPRTNPMDPNDLRRYTETYTYDVAGNLTQLVHTAEIGDGWTRTFTCAQPSQLEPDAFSSNRLTRTQVGSNRPEEYSYDEQGNMLTLAPMDLLRWNHLDQLVASSQQVVRSGVGEITYYVYDGAGQRIRKVTDHAADSVAEAERRTERLYLGDVEIYREFGPLGVVTLARTTVHINDGAGRIAMIDTRTDGGSGERLVRYQYGNHLGSAVVELDADAEPISYEEFHPYGCTALLITRNGRSKRYRYTGKEREEETGLNYHGARYLAPWLCRWTSADSMGDVDGPNRYRYARDRPTILVDPSGAASERAPHPSVNDIKVEMSLEDEAIGLRAEQATAKKDLAAAVKDLQIIEEEMARAMGDGATSEERRGLTELAAEARARIGALKELTEQLQRLIKGIEAAQKLLDESHMPDEVAAANEELDKATPFTKPDTPEEVAAASAEIDKEVPLTPVDEAAPQPPADAPTESGRFTGWIGRNAKWIGRVGSWLGRGSGPAAGALQDTPMKADGTYTADVLLGPGEMLDPHLMDAAFSGAQVEEAGMEFHITLFTMIGLAVGGPAGGAIGGLASANVVMYTAYRD